ncbi:MAG TPA: XdhC family protein [Pyrinomonadaceae bacterium]|nr:XdhC family protein [Pyrinomonadaceae bacterium]
MSPSESPESKPEADPITSGILQTLEDGSIAIVATLIEAANGDARVGAKLLIRGFPVDNKTVGSLGNRDLDQAVAAQAARLLESNVETRVFQVKDFAPSLSDWREARILFERIQREPRLVICGAGHVGASLASIASLMGYRATLIDDRAEFVNPELFREKNIELVSAEKWSEAVTAAVGDGHGVSMAIVTRGHSEDEQCLRAIIATDVDYIGLIGSKRRTNIVLQRLREEGAAEDRLKKVHAPVGLDIGAITPEEVALAIMAEIVAVRRGGEGGSLSAWRRQ